MARAKRPPPPTPKALEPLPPNTRAILRSGVEAVAYHIPIAPPSSTNPILKSTIALPRRSRWTSGLHFHTTHTEYLRLIKGSIFVELDGVTKILSAKAGGEISSKTSQLVKTGLEITVDKYARHNWGRAEEYLAWRWIGIGSVTKIVPPEDRDEEVIVEEWTDPVDIAKPLFFWNLNGVITAPLNAPLSARQSLIRLALGAWWIPFQLYIIFWDLDNWPIFFSLRLFSLGPSASSGNHLVARFGRLVEYLVTFVVLFVAKALGRLTGTQPVSRDRTPEELWQAYQKGR